LVFPLQPYINSNRGSSRNPIAPDKSDGYIENKMFKNNINICMYLGFVRITIASKLKITIKAYTEKQR